MIFEVIPYCLLYFIGLYNLKINSKTSNNIYFFILFAFSALRCDVGFDYMGYTHTINYGGRFEINRIELAERYMVLLSRDTFSQLFFIINSFITVYFTKWALERFSINLSVAGLAFLCFPNMYLFSMGVVRFWSAAALVFYASSFLKDKRYVKYIIFQGIALLFHNGAIVGLIFLPIYFLKAPYWMNFVFLILSFIGGEFIFNKILSGILPDNTYSNQLLHYVGLNGGEGGMTKIPYLYLFINIILLFFKELWSSSDELRKCISIFTLGVSFMFLFSFQTTLAIRISLPFLVYFMIVIPSILKYIKNKYIDYQPIMGFYIVFSFAIFIYLITIFNESLGKSMYLPYKLFFV